MKIVTVVGARPQFIKAAPVSRALRVRHQEILVHTGQHYDEDMSAVFFRELGIPDPDHHLAVGSAGHGAQTGAMLTGIERILLADRPDWVLVYGDTNSTLAGALAAAKLHIPIAHVEAGLRSYNRRMPEEINRVVTDHLATLSLCPSDVARDQLAREGITRGVQVVGDVMADALLDAARRATSESTIASRLQLVPGRYVLATIHRAENTDDAGRLRAILDGLAGSGFPVLLPLHPRTRAAMAKFGLSVSQTITISPPLGYLDLVAAAQGARVICTDSGGLQKEAYWLGVPCITMRGETEWIETVQHGWNRLVPADATAISTAVASASRPVAHPALYGGDGHAAQRVVAALESLPA